MMNIYKNPGGFRSSAFNGHLKYFRMDRRSIILIKITQVQVLMCVIRFRLII